MTLGVVHIVRRHQRNSSPPRYLGDNVVADIVFWHPVMPDLEIEPAREDLSQQLGGCDCRIEVAL